jgi:phospholipase/carboxylesterase
MAAPPALHTAGVPLQQASAAMILVHGRGATAPSILTLTAELDGPGFAYLAPQAPGQTWYPYSFLAPIEQNQPELDRALATMDSVVRMVEEAGLPAGRLILLGFSQGACLATEYAARHARRYGGLAGLSGGLIGPPGTPRAYEGDLAGTPVFLGCSDIDPHIPLWRVEETDTVLRQLGGEVTTQIYPGMGHTVNQDEIDHVQHLMDNLNHEQ